MSPIRNAILGYMNSMGGNNSMSNFNDSNDYMDMDLAPLCPPPRRIHCGELRDHHHGIMVELNGKVNRTRGGRFIELKDQYGVIQLVSPMEVTLNFQRIMHCV